MARSRRGGTTSQRRTLTTQSEGAAPPAYSGKLIDVGLEQDLPTKNTFVASSSNISYCKKIVSSPLASMEMRRKCQGYLNQAQEGFDVRAQHSGKDKAGTGISLKKAPTFEEKEIEAPKASVTFPPPENYGISPSHHAYATAAQLYQNHSSIDQSNLSQPQLDLSKRIYEQKLSLLKGGALTPEFREMMQKVVDSPLLTEEEKSGARYALQNAGKTQSAGDASSTTSRGLTSTGDSRRSVSSALTEQTRLLSTTVTTTKANPMPWVLGFAALLLLVRK